MDNQTDKEAFKPNNLRTSQDIEWNDAEILAKFNNNPPVVQSRLQALGLRTPTSMAIYQWVSRKRIPDRWRPTLVYVLKRDGDLPDNLLFKRGAKR